jgi:hypothetical protein
MNADFLVLKIQDEAGSLDELREGESRPLGLRLWVRLAIEQAFPSVRWPEPARGVWWSGEVFSVEIEMPRETDLVSFLTLKIRLNPRRAAEGWRREDEDELELFLTALCDPPGWTLFELPGGRLYRFRDETGEQETQPAHPELGSVN